MPGSQHILCAHGALEAFSLVMSTLFHISVLDVQGFRVLEDAPGVANMSQPELANGSENQRRSIAKMVGVGWREVAFFTNHDRGGSDSLLDARNDGRQNFSFLMSIYSSI